MTNLQTQVLTAVRGAISDAMAGHGPQTGLSDLDLDFSLPAKIKTDAAQLPVLRAEPARALTEVPREPARPRRWGVVVVVAVVAGTGLGAGILLGTTQLNLLVHHPEQPMPTATAKALPVAATISTSVTPAAPKVQAPPTPRDPLDSARDLISAGQIAKARGVLLSAGDTARPEMALLLARSFDPNFLATLPEPDSKPDIAEARRWYTRWFALASARGEVPETMRLDLLLRSLEAGKP
jgi:hypothetical protein